MIIQFFIYLRAELNIQWPITESARMQITAIIIIIAIINSSNTEQAGLEIML
jgi:hypothetical protein